MRNLRHYPVLIVKPSWLSREDCAVCFALWFVPCFPDKFGMERYLHQGLCVETCPEAFFHTEKTCEPCSQDCQLCSSLNRCLKCNPSFYLSDGRCVKLECGEGIFSILLLSHLCLSSSPSRFYLPCFPHRLFSGEVEDPDYDDCMACEEGCKKCVLCKLKVMLVLPTGDWAGLSERCRPELFPLSLKESWGLCVLSTDNPRHCLSCIDGFYK